MQNLPSTGAEFEAAILASATYFTAFCQIAPGNRVREELPTREAAEARAQAMAIEFDRSTLVYAVDAHGHQAFVAGFRPTMGRRERHLVDLTV